MDVIGNIMLNLPHQICFDPLGTKKWPKMAISTEFQQDFNRILTDFQHILACIHKESH